MKRKTVFKIKARTALMLCLCILLGTALCGCVPQVGPGGDTDPSGEIKPAQKSNKSVISTAKYPEMNKYPYTGDNGYVSYEEDHEDFTKWRKSRTEQAAHEYVRAGIDGFIRASTSKIFADTEDQNLIYSPVNVYMALAMLAEVSDNNTRKQILDLLGEESIADLRKQANAVWNRNYCDDGTVTSILAASVWLSEGLGYNKDTLDVLAKDYYASSFSGVMGSEEYDKLYRDWIDEQTGGFLKDQTSSLSLDPATVLALVTTVYFRAKWDVFNPEGTAEDTFRSPTGDVKCDFMNASFSDSPYYWGDKFAAASVDLVNSGRVWFILPDEGVTPEDLFADSEALSFMLSDSEAKYSYEDQKAVRVNLSVPKFDVNSSADLVGTLKSLGVTDCFDIGKADFSPMLNVPAAVSSVKHGARVAVDEEGITAAAFTEIALCGAAAPPEEEVDLKLDRPFIFVINGMDDLPLFVGVVNQP